MNDISYITLDLIKSKQQIGELFEFADFSFEYNLETIDLATNELIHSFQVGFLKNTLELFFGKKKKIYRPISKLIDFLNNSENIKQMIESKQLKDRLNYFNLILESYTLLSMIVESLINNDEEIDEQLLNLNNLGNNLFYSYLNFSILSVLTIFFKETNDFIFKDKHIKQLLRLFSISCNFLIEEEDIYSEFEEVFSFLNDKNNYTIKFESEFLELYQKVSNICIKLELKRDELYNEITEKIKKEND